jgi:hypothetical protein
VRTTLDIDEDVLHAAKELGRRERRTAGAVISELARRGLTVPRTAITDVAEPEEFYGFRPLPHRGGVVTNELIDELLESDAEG